MEGLSPAFPDWAYLPPGVVHLISQKVKSITDYVRFRAVCSPWRSSSIPKLTKLPPQLPWLMIPYQDSSLDDGIRLFYDIWQSKMHKIHLPEIIGNTCCASYRGWLLIVAPGGTELFLLNPLTRARIQLPLFTTPVTSIWDEGWNEGYIPPANFDFLFKSEWGSSVITKMIFSTDLTDPNCLIMVFLYRYQGMFFCKLGDHCWTEVVGPRAVLKDVAYCNGSFYFLNDKALYIYDLNQQKVKGTCSFKPELSSINSKFFLGGISGIYVIAVHNTEEGDEEAEEDTDTEKFSKIKVELYHVEEQQQEMGIAETSDITIFNGDNNHYLAVHTDGWDSLDGNCMYMENVCEPSPYNYWSGYCYSIFLAKLVDGNREPVALEVAEKSLTWPFVPAMWFQPSFF